MSTLSTERKTLLVFGYIRCCIQPLLSKHSIIPIDITKLCLLYYHLDRYIFMLTGDSGQNVKNNNISCFNMETDSVYKFNIFDHKDTSTIATEAAGWDTISCGLFHHRNLSLPSFLYNHYSESIKQIFKKMNHSITNFNVIFKCGGEESNTFDKSSDVYAILYDINIVSKVSKLKEKTIDALQISLPDVPFADICHNCIFSNKYGLVIHDRKNLYQLPFNNEIDSFKEWKWKKVKQRNNTDLKIVTERPFLMINEDEIMIINRLSSRLFNLNTRQCIDIPSPSFSSCFRCGIVYDKIENRVYCMKDNQIEWFDVEKRKWFDDIPSSQYRHSTSPAMFCEGSRLYVVGNGDDPFHDTIEYFDFKTKKWMTEKHKLDLQMQDSPEFERVFL